METTKTDPAKWQLIILLLLTIVAFKMLIIDPFNVPIEEPTYRAGGFVTSDNHKKSWYITRMPIVEGDQMVCIIQLSFPDGVFENCVSQDYLLSDTKLMKPYPTEVAKYIYFP